MNLKALCYSCYSPSGHGSLGVVGVLFSTDLVFFLNGSESVVTHP